MHKTIILFLIILAVGCRESLLHAQQAPRLLPFQGRLTDQNGVAVSNGVKLVQFKIYDVPTGGSPIWAGELHRTTVNGGLVNVMLGSKTPLSGVDFDKQLYLELTVDVSGPTGTPDNSITAADPPMLPRQVILPVIFAKESADSRLLDGYDWSPLFGTNNPAAGKIPGTKIAGRTITASNIAAGTITANEISTASLTTSQFSAQTLQDILIPPGSINAFMGINPPPGWLLCDGTVVGRTAYARLFAVIGTSSGPGDGSTTFHLPDLRGMFLRGVNGSRSGTDFLDPDAALRTNVITGANSGNTIGSVQFDELKSHSHNLSQNITQPAGGPIGGSGPSSAHSPDGGTYITATATGGSETRPKNVYVNYIIKH